MSHEKSESALAIIPLIIGYVCAPWFWFSWRQPILTAWWLYFFLSWWRIVSLCAWAANLRRINYFVAIERAGSFAGAITRKMRITNPQQHSAATEIVLAHRLENDRKCTLWIYTLCVVSPAHKLFILYFHCTPRSRAGWVTALAYYYLNLNS